jgi:predicted dehydrogenase
LHFVRVWNYVNIFPNGIGKEPDTAPPEGLNWEMYCGPAPLVPYNRKRWKATFRYFRDYSGGYITDYGTHRFDTVHQITGVDTPLSACANGGRYVLQDAGDTPDVMQVTYEYPGFVLSYESSLLSGYGIGGRSPGMKYYNARGPYDRPNGMAFYGTNGVLMADRVGFEVFPDLKQGSASEFRMERTSKNTTDATSLHAAAFVNAVREGKPPVADILVGHRAVTVPHLGNISLKVGRKVKWDSAKEQIVGDAEASKLLFRAPRKPYDIIK